MGMEGGGVMGRVERSIYRSIDVYDGNRPLAPILRQRQCSLI
jgi:hypothetical protein